jgi:hypothetical protein
VSKVDRGGVTADYDHDIALVEPYRHCSGSATPLERMNDRKINPALFACLADRSGLVLLQPSLLAPNDTR